MKLARGSMMGVGMVSFSQVSKVSLQASGLTCSMCSKAVKSALEEVGFVEKEPPFEA